MHGPVPIQRKIKNKARDVLKKDVYKSNAEAAGRKVRRIREKEMICKIGR